MPNTESRDLVKEIVNNPLLETGCSVPPYEHGASVVLNKYRDTIAYEEGELELKCGYPRFVEPPAVRELQKKVSQQFYDKADNPVVICPTPEVAQELLNYTITKSPADKGSIVPVHAAGVCAVVWQNEDSQAYKHAKKFLQHTGQIISSRHAESILSRSLEAMTFGGTQNLPESRALRTKIASLYSQAPEQAVFLHPTGMSSIHFAHNLVNKLNPNRKTAQVGFPYTDTKLLQQEFGNGMLFLPRADSKSFTTLEEALSQNQISAVFTEFPTNPLLESVNLMRLKTLCNTYKVPLVIDDTLSTPFNCNLTDVADILVTSLSKFAVGSADVMGGSLVIPEQSQFKDELRELAKAHYQDICFIKDISRVLERIDGYEQRVKICGDNAYEIVKLLSRHPAVEQVLHPSVSNSKDLYDVFRLAGRNYGGLLSFTVKGPEQNTIDVFDNLYITKAPGLGTEFTMGCMYTLLAHYEELEEVAKHSVSKNLIRISIGTEPLERLQKIFLEALEKAQFK